jgi:CBS domain containing-hemolysin-like protein
MVILFIYLALAIGVSFICSILEAVLLSVNPGFIAHLKTMHPGAGGALQKFKNDIDIPLSAILSLNTIAHTLGAAGVGAQAQRVFGSAYVGIISAVLTLLILVLSEIIPKTLGATYWRALAVFAARALQIMIAVMYPFVILSRMITNLLSAKNGDKAFSREELSAQVELGAEQGVLERSESRIFKNMIRFNSLCAKDIMTPRTVIIAYPEKTQSGQIADDIKNVPVSRIPLYGKSKDHLTGYMLKTDLLLSIAQHNNNKQLIAFKREILILPDVVELSVLFERLLERQEHIAALIDEYGALSGIVTQEDIVETILGMEIVDEQDSVTDMQAFARKRWNERARRLGLIES